LKAALAPVPASAQTLLHFPKTLSVLPYQKVR
jgi:hypothetical protein